MRSSSPNADGTNRLGHDRFFREVRPVAFDYDLTYLVFSARASFLSLTMKQPFHIPNKEPCPPKNQLYRFGRTHMVLFLLERTLGES